MKSHTFNHQKIFFNVLKNKHSHSNPNISTKTFHRLINCRQTEKSTSHPSRNRTHSLLFQSKQKLASNSSDNTCSFHGHSGLSNTRSSSQASTWTHRGLLSYNSPNARSTSDHSRIAVARIRPAVHRYKTSQKFRKSKIKKRELLKKKMISKPLFCNPTLPGNIRLANHKKSD